MQSLLERLVLAVAIIAILGAIMAALVALAILMAAIGVTILPPPPLPPAWNDGSVLVWQVAP